MLSSWQLLFVVVATLAAAASSPSPHFGIVEPGAWKSRRAHAASKELSHLVDSKFNELDRIHNGPPPPTTAAKNTGAKGSDGGDETPEAPTDTIPDHHSTNSLLRKKAKGLSKSARNIGRVAAASIGYEPKRSGICPANGNLRTLYITTQRGNNIVAFDSFGRYLGLVIRPETFPRFFDWEDYKWEEGDEGEIFVTATNTSEFSSTPTELYGVQKLRQVKYGPDGLLYAASGRASLSRIFALSPDGVLEGSSSHGSIASITPTLREEDDPLMPRLDSSVREKEVFSSLPASLRMNTDCTRNYVYTLARLQRDEGEETSRVFTATTSSPSPSKSTKKSNKKRFGDLVVTPSADTPPGASVPAVVVSGAATKGMPPVMRRTHYYNPNMQHPYDFIFHPDDGTLFVTNQNSVSVTWYVGPTTTTKQLNLILDRSIEAAERALLPALKADSSRDNKEARAELKANVKRVMMQLMDNAVAPVGEGDARDPLPLAGGRSTYAGMPLPPSYAVMSSLLTYHNLISSGGKRFNNKTKVDMSSAATKVRAAGGGEESTIVIDPTPSLLLPTEAVGVFASAETHTTRGEQQPLLGNPFSSVRGIAISPLLPFSPSEGVFLHELSPEVVARLTAQRAARYGLIDSSKAMRASTKKAAKSSGVVVDDDVEMVRVVVVADVVGNTIHVLHEHTGEVLWQYVNVIQEPVQIHFPKRGVHMTAENSPTHANDFWFYVTSKSGGVYRVPLRREAAAATPSSKSVFSTIQTLIDARGHVVGANTASSNPNAVSATSSDPESTGTSSSVKAASGFFEDPDHNVAFLADRKGMRVRTYATPDDLVGDRDSSSHAATSGKQYLRQVEQSAALEFTGDFVKNLPDLPEFLLYTRVDSHTRIPVCRELTRSGILKISSLCIAVQVWLLLGLAALIWVSCTRTRIGVIMLGTCCGRTLTTQKLNQPNIAANCEMPSVASAIAAGQPATAQPLGYGTL